MAWLAFLHNSHFYSTRGLRQIYYLLMHIEALLFTAKRHLATAFAGREKFFPFSTETKNTKLLSSENALKQTKFGAEHKPEE